MSQITYRNEEDKTDSEYPNGSPSQKIKDQDRHSRLNFIIVRDKVHPSS